MDAAFKQKMALLQYVQQQRRDWQDAILKTSRRIETLVAQRPGVAAALEQERKQREQEAAARVARDAEDAKRREEKRKLDEDERKDRERRREEKRKQDEAERVDRERRRKEELDRAKRETEAKKKEEEDAKRQEEVRRRVAKKAEEDAKRKLAEEEAKRKAAEKEAARKAAEEEAERQYQRNQAEAEERERKKREENEKQAAEARRFEEAEKKKFEEAKRKAEAEEAERKAAEAERRRQEDIKRQQAQEAAERERLARIEAESKRREQLAEERRAGPRLRVRTFLDSVEQETKESGIERIRDLQIESARLSEMIDKLGEADQAAFAGERAELRRAQETLVNLFRQIVQDFVSRVDQLKQAETIPPTEDILTFRNEARSLSEELRSMSPEDQASLQPEQILLTKAQENLHQLAVSQRAEKASQARVEAARAQATKGLSRFEAGVADVEKVWEQKFASLTLEQIATSKPIRENLIRFIEDVNAYKPSPTYQTQHFETFLTPVTNPSLLASDEALLAPIRSDLVARFAALRQRLETLSQNALEKLDQGEKLQVEIEKKWIEEAEQVLDNEANIVNLDDATLTSLEVQIERLINTNPFPPNYLFALYDVTRRDIVKALPTKLKTMFVAIRKQRRQREQTRVMTRGQSRRLAEAEKKEITAAQSSLGARRAQEAKSVEEKTVEASQNCPESEGKTLLSEGELTSLNEKLKTLAKSIAAGKVYEARKLGSIGTGAGSKIGKLVTRCKAIGSLIDAKYFGGGAYSTHLFPRGTRDSGVIYTLVDETTEPSALGVATAPYQAYMIFHVVAFDPERQNPLIIESESGKCAEWIQETNAAKAMIVIDYYCPANEGSAALEATRQKDTDLPKLDFTATFKFLFLSFLADNLGLPRFTPVLALVPSEGEKTAFPSERIGTNIWQNWFPEKGQQGCKTCFRFRTPEQDFRTKTNESQRPNFDIYTGKGGEDADYTRKLVMFMTLTPPLELYPTVARDFL